MRVKTVSDVDGATANLAASVHLLDFYAVLAARHPLIANAQKRGPVKRASWSKASMNRRHPNARASRPMHECITAPHVSLTSH